MPLKCPLDRQDRLARAMAAAKRAGARLLIGVLERLRRGCVEFRDNLPGDDCYHAFLRPEDARAFRKRGHRML